MHLMSCLSGVLPVC